jgi:hypothetical protein
MARRRASVNEVCPACLTSALHSTFSAHATRRPI